jgi:hypothetical protein
MTVVMAGLVPAIHVFLLCSKDVDARHQAGHDERISSTHRLRLWRGRHVSREKPWVREKIFGDYQP